jgi:RsiW-degrading membrane proteinase PrsW (M82 family)
VPGHAFFGVAMGYYFALMKYLPKKRKALLAKAFFVPFFLHGTYNFILLADIPYAMWLFVPFVAYLWMAGFRKMKRHVESSPFKKISAR